MREGPERSTVGRHVTTLVLSAACCLLSHSAQADQVLNLELSGGAGVTAYNLATDTALAPPFVQFQAAYLPVRTGPVNQGPTLGLPIGFFRPEGQDTWETQVGVRLGWQIFGRPSVDFGWNAVAAFDLVMMPSEEAAGFVWGFELGGSAAYFLTAGLALTAGIRYAFFYGIDPVHVFSGQIGVMISYEVVR